MPKRATINKKPFTRSFTNTDDSGLIQTDSRGTIISASEQLSAFTGLTIRKLVGSSLTDITVKKDHAKLASFLRKEKLAGKHTIAVLLKGESRNRTFKFSVEIIPRGGSRNFLLNWIPVIAKAKASGSHLVDVKQMFDSNPQPVMVYEPGSLSVLYANPAACALFGHSYGELVTMSFKELFDGISTTSDPSPDDMLKCNLKHQSGYLPAKIFTSPIPIKNKAYRLAFLNVLESGASSSNGSMSELAKDYRDPWQILDDAPEVFFKLDVDGNFVFVSSELERTLGYSKTEVQGKHYTTIVHPDDRDIARQGFADVFQFGRAKGNVIFRVIKKAGGIQWVSTSAIFLYDNEGKPLYSLGFAQNVTEIKELIEKLEASEERYAAFINHSSEAIWRFETLEPLDTNLPEEILIKNFINKGYLAECNDQMARSYGFEEASDITGAPLDKFIPVEDAATMEYFKGFIQSGFKLVNVETHETDKEGNQKIFLNNLLGIVENNKLVRVWGTQRDITDHRLSEKKAKELLEESENFFKSLISDSLDGIIVLDREGYITYAAGSITNVLGYRPEHVIGRKGFDFIHPDDVKVAEQAFDNQLNNVSGPYLEIRFQASTGNWLWMLVRSNNLYQHPSVRGLVVYFTDITQRKHTDSILKESEKRFRYLADTVPVMIWVSDENNKITYISKYWADFTGVSLEDIEKNGWKKVIHPEDHKLVVSQYDYHFRQRQSFVREYRVKTREGGYNWVVDHGVPRFTQDGTFMGYIGSVTDIHHRKMAEQKLIYQARLMENVRDAIIATDLDFNVIAWNNTAEQIYGFKKEDVIGKHLKSLIHLEYIDTSPENVMIELYEKDSWEGEVYFDRAVGKRVYLFFSLSFVKNESGERIGLISIHRDITERYESEMALRISEERYRSVVDALNEGIILQDNTGKMIACNRRATAILGQNLTDSPFKIHEGKCIKEDGSPFTDDDNPFSITLRTGKPLQGVIMGLQRPGTSFNWFSVNTEPIYYSTERIRPDVVVTSFFDITQRIQQEQWLLLEKDVLEVNAKSSATLQFTLDFYLRGIEKMFPDMITSVLMLKEDKQTIQHLSAPSLPGAFSKAVNGIKIGPGVGSCGHAMFIKQRVITNDIATDILWQDYRELAAQFDLRSCWSFPIVNSQLEVIATIAVYHRYPKMPTTEELNIMEVVCNLLRVIFENKKAEADLRLSNERYLLATKATHDAIYDWDILANTVYRGESFCSLFGYSRTQAGGLIHFLEQKLHPADRHRVVKSLKRFVENKSPDIWECEYRFMNSSGRYVVVFDRGFLIFNHEGQITRLVGSMMDITERKELEKKLLKQEVDRQKLIAQAVVNAQEKERAEIGKELHDNVNQILSTARLYLELAKSDEKERLNLIKRSYDNIYDAINEIRSISRSLVPPSVGDIGLVESIEDLVENVRATKKLYIEFCYGGDVDALLGQKQKLMLFRIIQEQVNNVLKHANANNIIIELMIDGHMINLAVSDDGQGFDYEAVKNNKGVGLQNIASRTELFNGKINIVTAPNKGCKLNIHVPISKL